MAWILSFLMFAFFAGGPARAETPDASLTVRIENVSARGGMMRLGIYTKDAYDRNSTDAVVSLDVAATAPVQEVEFAPVPPGTYAVQVYQDINGNGHMDYNWAGLPTEPYGFSRDAHPLVAKPDFALAKVTLNAGRNILTIHLQNVEKKRAPQP
ncbi:MAG TPA: DUF2141 domain-containing protein [Rhizomicrobium sp.]|nr:DUF2141 domain-containing protein [Rhizomicrobium sp.]